MKRNPFYNRQRITDPNCFIGRKSEVETLYSAVVTRQCRSLVGERKMGKSSLLTHICNPAIMRSYGLDPERQLLLYFDLEGMASAKVEDFWLEILEAIGDRLPSGDLAEATQKLVNSSDVRFMAVRRLLRRIRDGGFDLVLCLDEFESLARNPEFEPDFYGELRSLAGELGLVYITASKRSLYELTYEHTDTLSSPFFNIFSELPLGALEDPDANALLAELSGKDGEVPFCQEEIAFARDLAGGHPFFLQIAGFHLIETPGRGTPRTNEGYAQIRKRYLAEAEDHYRYLWSQLSSTQQMALIHLEDAPEPVLRILRIKSLVEERDNKPVPFCQTFAEFLQRQRAEGGTFQSTATAPTSGSDLIGRTLGNYRIVSPIGQGGMAEVFKGYQSKLDRYVAIKILSPRFAADAEFFERFQREAAAVAKLRHPNIVQVFDFGSADNLTFMVMEYVPGPTLKERIRSLHSQGQQPSHREVIAIAKQIASALDHAHTNGLVHRDVKPANILLRTADFEQATVMPGPTTQFSPNEYAVLTDFGVVKMVEGLKFTATGMTMGTPDYMSPEQARGEDVTSSSDIYALAVVVYEMLVGQLPFYADTPLAVLLKHMNDLPPKPHTILPKLPIGVDLVLGRALAKTPAERYATASDFSNALEGVLS
ncbi:MAG TPA: protein kinase [Anaerolineaceae bacterium]|jgi:AAA+ ATPase superfamily predicted ATPase|nr:protein kinase [Anaerolineaceae bacterium]